jgi:hypothetical protein
MSKTVFSIITLLFFCCLNTQAQPYDYRHPWYAPFAATSIWNTPIGSGATLVSANLPTSYSVCADEEWLIRVDAATATSQVVNTPSSWGVRWPGNSAWWQGSMLVPNNLIIPDANPPNSTPNACATFLQPDKETIIQLEPTCRKFANQQIVGYRFGTEYNIYSNGEGGTHYGSSLSAIGGSIRLGELLGSEPIRHALKLNIWGNYLYYGGTNTGYRWPATTADACASTCYLGTNPKMVMGTLVTIPQSVTAASLGITTSVGQKILTALKNYGAYIVDNSGWNAYDWSTELGVEAEVQTQLGINICGTSGAYHADMQLIIPQLKIVDNNTATTIGGGGTPVTTLAKPFCTAASSITITPQTIPASTNIKYKTASFQASTYTWSVTNGSIVGGSGNNEIIVNWNGNTSGSVAVTVTNEYCTYSKNYAYTPTMLPLTLLEFSGKNVAKNENLLTWLTTNEENISRFEVEKAYSNSSQNGELRWNLIKNVDARNTQKIENYSLTDFITESPLDGFRGYYRLKIIDRDGNFSFSQIITIEKKMGATTIFYPNPSNGIFTILTADKNQKILLFNEIGLLVKEYQSVPETIDLSTFPIGVYIAQIGEERIKVVKM